ncbi:MAG: hypothetical protein IANPNBLG_01251 [Bryobacteraceae bacterium]|nr:hypothetical protein [Bryobacteraceae bacterium]
MTVHGSIGFSCAMLFLAAGLSAQSPAEDYAQSCAMCHTIGGGPLAGPDLAGMSSRRERAWLVRFIVDPQAVIDSGDATAKALVQSYQGMVMPAIPDMTPERATALVDYVRQQEGNGGAAKTAQGAAPEPFTPQEAERGEALFSGLEPFEAGGTACIACHDTGGLPLLGGGSLGPSLTHVFQRLGGRKGLETWLASPPTPAMASLYRRKPFSEQEITALIAYFEARAAGQAKPAKHADFLLLGSAGTVLLLFIFHLLWRERFHGVRARLVRQYRTRGVQ